jgi:hypothetical protein
MKNQDKGQIRTIEAFLAVLIIFSSFAVSSSLTVTQRTSRNADLASVGLQALMTLDSDGSLGAYISNGDWTGLQNAFETVLPIGMCFNLTVYDDQMQQVSNASISNGGFSSQQVAFVEYVVATQEAVLRYYIVRVKLAVAT